MAGASSLKTPLGSNIFQVGLAGTLSSRFSGRSLAAVQGPLSTRGRGGLWQ
jgi:hypothetical protein